MLSNEQFTLITTYIITSFLGAIIALLFSSLTGLIGRIIRRKIKHYNSLITLEGQLNEMIGILKDNVYLLPGFKTAIQTGNIYFSQIRTIPIDRSHLTNLADIALINDVFNFFYKLRKLNDDTESLDKGYKEIKSAYIDKKISTEHYAENGVVISQQLVLLEKFHDDLLENLIELMTKIRIQIRKDKPLIVKIQEIFKYNSSEKISLKEFKDEKKRLEGELEESSKQSRKEIAKILKK